MGKKPIPNSLHLIPLSLVGFFSFLAANYQLDDALIYLRYIRNFHEGHGLVYNYGELFNGLTSPFFSYLVLVFSYFFDYQVANIVVSAIFMAGAAVIGGLIFARTPVEFIAISSMVASFSYFYSTFGMESSVFICLIGLAMLLIKNKIECAWPVLALLVSTRSEGIFLAAPAALLLAYQNRRLPRLPYLLASVIIVATPFIVNQLYYGAMFPHSANAKLGQGRSGLWGKPPAFIHIGYMRNWFLGEVSRLSGFCLAYR